MESVFITGASGCVGHYIVDALAGKYELFLLVRNPNRLKFDPTLRPNVNIVRGDLNEISSHADLLKRMDYCIHAATAWGGKGTMETNVVKSHEMFSLFDPDKVKRIVYFSTASILGRDGKPLPGAEQFGTEYVRSKYACYAKLSESPIYDRIVTVFPTMVFGGDTTHPYSHMSGSLPMVKKLAWLIRRLNVEGSFHFIHAEDIAKVVRYIVECPEPKRDYVIGNEPITFGEFTQRVGQYFGKKPGWQFKLSPDSVLRLGKILHAQMSDWDRFCMEYKHFVYDTVNCPKLGLSSTRHTVEGILADWHLPLEGRKLHG